MRIRSGGAASYFAGIDEAGRGPLAGPVAVGIVLARERNPALSFFKEVKDSKQLSSQKRLLVYEGLKGAKERGEISFAVSLVGSETIDRVGINNAVKTAVKRCLLRLACDNGKTRVLLDGGLRAPREFIFQETIIRGDEKEALIALASIVAKVTRDRKMERFSARYPNYFFDEHKGYGTDLHRKLIRRYKPCAIHRMTYLKRVKF